MRVIFSAILFFAFGIPFLARAQGNPTCDFNADGKKDVTDLGILLSSWGASGSPQDCSGDGRVDVIDLGILLSGWGGTPQVCTPNQTCPACYTSQQCRGICSSDGMYWQDGDPQDNCPDYPPVGDMQPFPHVAAFTWGGAVPWYDAKFDLMMTSSNSAGWAQARRAYNPQMILLTTRDINAGAGMGEAGLMPEAAWAHSSREGTNKTSASRCYVYSPDTWLANYTNYAPAVFGGKRFNEHVGDWYAQIVPRPPFDGYASDGLWPGKMDYYSSDNQADPHNCAGDIDLNSNGVNDFNEGIDVDGAFRQGAETVTANLRRTAGDGYILLNSGGWDNAAWRDKNGMVNEHGNPAAQDSDWWWWIKETHDAFAAGGRTPILLLMDTEMANPGSNGGPNPPRDDFQFMRFALTLMSLNDGYVSVSHDPNGSHYWVDYYDEFDVRLGMPTSAGGGHEIQPHVFVRFFQNGAVINNSSNNAVSVSQSQLAGLSGYTGPYYRFQGGQNPQFNDGQAFSSVTLGVRNSFHYTGDGIVLVNGNAPRTALTDIIVDNNTHSTSPGSPDAVLNGFTDIDDCGTTISNEYTHRCAVHYESYPAALAPGGSNATAVFTPRIGVAGTYRVYEWHGNLNNGSAASAVTYRVNNASPVNNSCTACSVNQRANTGAWNLLGTYQFGAGASVNVTIEASGASGTVIADAVRFEWAANSSVMGIETSRASVIHFLLDDPLTNFNFYLFASTLGLSLLLWAVITPQRRRDAKPL